MCITYPGNEQMVKHANEFKLTDDFEETVNESIFFNMHLSDGGGSIQKKTSQVMF